MTEVLEFHVQNAEAHRDPSRTASRRGLTLSRALAADPRPVGCLKLTSFSPPAWRVKVSGYRIVYDIDDDQIVVVIINVAPRGEVYR